MENDSELIRRPLNLALKYLSYQPRTVHEMQTYIKKKGFNQEVTIKIIDILKEKKYLNDRDFAILFIESRIKTKPKSKFAFTYELKKRGISAVIIDDILEPYDDQDLALKAVRSKIKTWQRLDSEKYKKKMMNFLQYRGFNFDICQSTIDHFIQSNDVVKEG